MKVIVVFKRLLATVGTTNMAAIYSNGVNRCNILGFNFTKRDALSSMQMSHSAKIVCAIFYEHALAAILAVSVIHAMKREQSRILAVSAILAVSVARVIWRDSLAKIADTKIMHRDRYTVRHLV